MAVDSFPNSISLFFLSVIVVSLSPDQILEKVEAEAVGLRAGDSSQLTSTATMLIRAAALNSCVAVIRKHRQSEVGEAEPCGDASELGLYR